VPVAIPDTSARLRSTLQFVPGIRFEIFLALMALTGDDHGIHIRWSRNALERLPEGFRDRARALSGASEMWPVLADVLEAARPDLSIDELLSRIAGLSIEAFQREILLGGLHEQELVSGLVAGTRNLQDAMASLDERQQKWFRFLGLYPYREDAPTVRAIHRLIESPVAFREDLVDLLDIFWRDVFEDTWSAIEPRMQASADEKRRLLEALPPSEFARQVLIRLEIDDDTLDVSCSCMGRMPLTSIEAAYVIPSVFNEKRLWSLYTHGSRYTICVPYFDPGISVAIEPRADDAFDPAQVFKALGEPTRYELLRLIAERPRTSADLAKVLHVSKPTISHHVQQLRSAGLIGEEAAGTGVLLSLRREVIARLSDRALADLARGRKTKAPAPVMAGALVQK
jgi:DNA-binding transcriptional ArsR family regulator